MAVENTHMPSSESQQPAAPTVSQLLERLGRYEGPPEQFLLSLLDVQCRLAAASAGAILRLGPQGPAALAVYPPLEDGATAPVWLAQAAEGARRVVESNRPSVRALSDDQPLYGQPASRHLVMVPLPGREGVRGVGAYLLETADRAAIARAVERLELTVGLLSLYEMRLTLQRRGGDLKRLRAGMEVLSAVNQSPKFAGAAMALCNELVSRWNCERVSIGLLRGRYVKLQAMSHTEKFSRKMQLVRDLEAAMEECLDQDLEILAPADEQATYVHRAGGQLARREGGCVLSLPLRHEGEVFGVLTLERPGDRPFAAEEIESLRLTADLTAGRLVDLDKHGRWFGARWLTGLRGLGGAVVGPKHTWAKLGGIAAAVVLLALLLVRGEYRANAPFALQPRTVRLVEAPYDGRLVDVYVEPGQWVRPETELGQLDANPLKLEYQTALGRMRDANSQRAEAVAGGLAAEAQRALFRMQQARAEARSLQRRIDQATLRSPIAGTVLQAVKERETGSAARTNVQKGDPLFRISPVREMLAELAIPEDQISDVQVGQRGQLIAEAFPDQRIDFVVERIDPMAVVEDGQNVFKVRARLVDLDLHGEHSWMRVGMKGSAKVVLGEKPLGVLWTRRLVNWIRMKLWLL